MPYDFTYMWNLKYKINEQTKQKQTDGYRDHAQLLDGRKLGDV